MGRSWHQQFGIMKVFLILINDLLRKESMLINKNQCPLPPPPSFRVAPCLLCLQSTLPFVSHTFFKTGSSIHGHSNLQVGHTKDLVVTHYQIMLLMSCCQFYQHAIMLLKVQWSIVVYFGITHWVYKRWMSFCHFLQLYRREAKISVDTGGIGALVRVMSFWAKICEVAIRQWCHSIKFESIHLPTLSRAGLSCQPCI